MPVFKHEVIFNLFTDLSKFAPKFAPKYSRVIDLTGDFTSKSATRTARKLETKTVRIHNCFLHKKSYGVGQQSD